MSRRTPFEVRLDTLHLAQRILTETAAARRDNARDMRAHIMDNGEIKSDDGTSYTPTFDDHTFTVEDVLEDAKKLYDFVCTDENISD